jgi:hypothetical protein
VSVQRRPIAEPRSLERYIRSQVIPRFITRLREIEDGFVTHRMALARRYAEVKRLSGGDARVFEARWRSVARRWDFAGLNELIRQHNEYYPIERRLPVDPRTGEYLTSAGRPYRREPLGPEWILERFPPVLDEPGE